MFTSKQLSFKNEWLKFTSDRDRIVSDLERTDIYSIRQNTPMLITLFNLPSSPTENDCKRREIPI